VQENLVLLIHAEISEVMGLKNFNREKIKKIFPKKKKKP
jgi:hypothetical protein